METSSLIGVIGRALDDTQLKLYVLPTEQCNFRCTYCYEDFKEKAMAPSIVSALKQLIARRAPGLSKLHLEWFGGEPLAARAIVEDVGRYVTALREEYPFFYSGAITTNGWFLDVETAATLVSLGTTAFQVSLDGFGEVHDRTRLRSGGGGTFGRIWDNLLSLRTSDIAFRIMIRVHVSPANFGDMPVLIDALNDAFDGDSRFSILFKSVARLGGPNDATLPVFSGVDVDNAVASLAARLRSPAQGADVAHAQVCYAAEANAWVVRSNGDLAKCTVAFADVRNRVGRLREDGTIEVDHTRWRPWLRGLSTGDERYLSCPYAAMLEDDSAKLLAADELAAT